MGEKKLYLYVCDDEYGKRLLRYLNSHRHPTLRVEMVTERERFWESRSQRKSNDEYWLTDDVSGSLADPGDRSTLWMLADRSDGDRHRIGYAKKAPELLRELMGIMALTDVADRPSGAPPPGVYGVYSPGEEGTVTAALLSQELGTYGACIYVNLCEFPVFYTSESVGEKNNLGELFFRLESKDYKGLVEQSQITYGKATRLPTVSHYRDLWDVGDEDRRIFFRRLTEECDRTYVVVLFNDVREAMPMLGQVSGFIPVSRKGCEEAFTARWRRYAKTENHTETDPGTTVVMPDGWTAWIRDMENQPPENWLRDENRQAFVKGVLEEVSR
ncbi:MAG: hypothetical protein VZQ83_03860 [Eubacterium sp.]|nr:hypothetical protein [Eubacterium sp.]